MRLVLFEAQLWEEVNLWCGLGDRRVFLLQLVDDLGNFGVLGVLGAQMTRLFLCGGLLVGTVRGEIDT